MPKNWCFWTVVLEKTLENPLDCKEIQLVHPKGNQSWIFIGRTDTEAQTPIIWPPDVKSWLIWKDPDAGKDWRQKKGMSEDEIVGWHHRLDGYESEQTLGEGEGQEAWHAVVLEVWKSWTWLSDWTTVLHKSQGEDKGEIHFLQQLGLLSFWSWNATSSPWWLKRNLYIQPRTLWFHISRAQKGRQAMSDHL